MLFSFISLITLTSLTHALPADLNLGHPSKDAIALESRGQGPDGPWPPPVYPGGFNPSTCPDNSAQDNTGFAIPQLIPPNKKRSLDNTVDSSSFENTPALIPRVTEINAVCAAIAHLPFIHYSQDRIGNTNGRRLITGVQYVFSFGCTAAINRIRAFIEDGNGGFNVVAQNTPNNIRGSLTFEVPMAGIVHFEVRFTGTGFRDGEFVLYEISGHIP